MMYIGIGVLVLIVAVAFFMKGCKITCNKEGFQRQCLGGTCAGMQRSPVDFAMKGTNGWQQNPHWEAYPVINYQPLSDGPVDFYRDSKKLSEGEMFHQYGQDYEGIGQQISYMKNDEKNRFDGRDIGNYAFSARMDNLYNPKFGSPGIENVEEVYWDPNPYFDKLYGGAQFLRFGKLI